jgi:hypothetical protein
MINIDYKFKDQYREQYNDANGVFVNKKNIEKGKKYKSFYANYFRTFLLYLILCIFVLLTGLIIKNNLISIMGLLLTIGYVILATFVIYAFNKNMDNYRNRTGKLIIDNLSINDKNNVESNTYSISDIESIVITKLNIIFLFKNLPKFLFIPNNKKSKEDVENKFKDNKDIKIYYFDK